MDQSDSLRSYSLQWQGCELCCPSLCCVSHLLRRVFFLIAIRLKGNCRGWVRGWFDCLWQWRACGCACANSVGKRAVSVCMCVRVCVSCKSANGSQVVVISTCCCGPSLRSCIICSKVQTSNSCWSQTKYHDSSSGIQDHNVFYIETPGTWLIYSTDPVTVLPSVHNHQLKAL